MATISIPDVQGSAGEVADGALVEAHLDGDPTAFDVVYERYLDRLTRFCWKQTHDWSLAEDLAQEAMIRCLRSADRFDTSRPMWPWLKTIARNLVIDHHRRTDSDADLEPNLGTALDSSAATVTDTVIRLDRVEQRSALAPVLAQLPDRQRVALRLHYGQDWTTADVANYLDIKVNACKQLLYRARKNARRYYEELQENATGALSVVLAHPAFLAVRERYQRARGAVGTWATDVAGMTIALETITERAVVALAVIAAAVTGTQTNLDAVPAAHTVRADAALSASSQASVDAAGTIAVDPPARSVPVPDRRGHARDANPDGTSVGLGTSTGDLGADLPMASMAADAEGASDERVGVTARALAYVPGVDEEDPVVGRTGAEVHCDPDAPVTYSTACAGLDALETIAPPPEE